MSFVFDMGKLFMQLLKERRLYLPPIANLDKQATGGSPV
jgi:hypothetical protein